MQRKRKWPRSLPQIHRKPSWQSNPLQPARLPNALLASKHRVVLARFVFTAPTGTAALQTAAALFIDARRQAKARED